MRQTCAAVSRRISIVALLLFAFAFAYAPAGQAAPNHTISRYISTTDVSRWYDLGCLLGQAVANGSRPMDGTVFLAFGRPYYDGTSYGTIIYNNSFRTTAQIRQVAYNYGYGYYVCAPQGATLEVSIGTTNLGGYTTFSHGQAWANMVDATNDMYVNNCCIADAVYASGANDMELDWNPPAATRAWGDGYNAAGDWWYNNFGDAAGCPPYGSCKNGWTQDDLWYVSWGIPAAFPFPQIYNETGANAQQWQRVSLRGYTDHDGNSMLIMGAAAQYQACLDKGDPCTGVNNTAAQAWTQLYNELNSDSRTAQDGQYSTDFSWNN